MDAGFDSEDGGMDHTYWDSSDSEEGERFSSAMHDEFTGTDPVSHLEWATKLPHPWHNTVSPLSQEQVSALREMVQDPTGSHQRLVEKLQYWTERKNVVAAANESYRATLEPHQRKVVGKVDLFLLDAMLAEAEHVDSSLVTDLLKGFPVTGDLADVRLGVPIPGGQRVHGKPGMGGATPLSELESHCRQVNERTLRRAQAKLAKASADEELNAKVWEKLLQDQAN